MALGARMEAEIGEQPDALAANAERYYQELRACLGVRKFAMALLVARGSSDNAALYARYLIEVGLRIPVSLAAPSVLTRLGARVRYPDCLAIGVSQSGAAPDVSEVLAEVRSQGHATLAITNNPSSRVACAAEEVLDLRVGPEEAVAATKTYTASLLALYQVVRALGADLPSPSLPTQAWSALCKGAAESCLEGLLASERWFALGRGYSFASALEAALKLMECALLPCKGYSVADFAHGPRALAVPGTFLLTFSSEAVGLENRCAVARAPAPAKGPADPIWEAFTAQWLALLAARERGLDPDRPGGLTKVTETL